MTVDPRFLVIQYGARHAYGIPLAFSKCQSLAGLYTDLTSQSLLGRTAKLVAGWQNNQSILKRLSRRTLPEEIVPFTKSLIVGATVGEAITRVPISSFRENYGNDLSKRMTELEMKLSGTQGATHIYTMFGEGGEFISYAKEKGLGIVGDVYIALSADPIVSEEEQRYPSWCHTPIIEARVEDQRERNKILLTKSDLLVCPSEFVRDDLILNHGVNLERTIVAPYSIDHKWTNLQSAPIPRRILFAGSAIVRKGIHYFAMAAKGLSRHGYQFRVAGSASSTVRHHKDASELIFLGHLSSQELEDEFRQADVFVFPTLAEGSASVVTEALGAGIPVVTTHAAGSLVRNGTDGFIVTERDPSALIEAIRCIAENRQLRTSMSESARIRAQSYSWDDFSQTVISATKSIAGPSRTVVLDNR